MTKEYRAIVWGVIDRDSDLIDTFVRVNPETAGSDDGLRRGGNARRAVTAFEVLERFYDFTYVRLFPRTGRTHQLRVHMRHLGHPIVADRLYGGRAALTRSYLAGEESHQIAAAQRATSDESPTEADDVLICRHALHALRLAFRHPATGKPVEFEAPLPADMENTLAALRNLAPPKML